MAEPKIENILNDLRLAEAVTKINRRAEKQIDYEKLINVFVQTDLPTRCLTTDHQLVLGRRGTGKTHLLRYFQYQQQLRGQVVHYCDCVTLGSGLPNASSDPVILARKYFVALINDLATLLFDKLLLTEGLSDEQQDKVVGHLTDGIIRFLDPDSGGDSTFNYRQISQTLDAVLSNLEIQRLYLILDEWAQIPRVSQPYVAEFLKRAVLTVPSISVKILAVNYQCRFSEYVNGTLVGLQRGADFTDTIDLDSYLVFDQNKTFVIEFFAQLLYNHVGAELGWSLDIDPNEKLRTIKKLFTQEPAFIDLVRAAEGNCRDFICIFAKAFLEGYRQSDSSKAISIPQVETAAGSWYSAEKESNIRSDPEAQRTITFLLNKVLKDYKSRSFLVEIGQEDNERLVHLLNERVVHKLNLAYSHRDKPGLRYEIYSLDYGAYVRYKGTVNEPHQMVIFTDDEARTLSDEERKSLVPFDDRRSIRRIVFSPDSLEVTTD